MFYSSALLSCIFTFSLLTYDIGKSGLYLKSGLSGFMGWPFGSSQGVYGAIGFDRLHVLKGLIEKMVNVLDEIVKAECPPTRTSKTAMHSYLLRKHVSV